MTTFLLMSDGKHMRVLASWRYVKYAVLAPVQIRLRVAMDKIPMAEQKRIFKKLVKEQIKRDKENQI